MTRCTDVCSGSSCPSNPLFYTTRCNDLCLQNDCNGGSVSSPPDFSDKCMNCLESSNPTSCQEHWQCKAGETCQDSQNSNIGRCKICIFNIYFAMMKCVRISRPQQLTNCILDKVYSHCKSCVCWAACKFGLKPVCNCCRRGQCSQSRIDPHLQSMLAIGRKGTIRKKRSQSK